MTDGTGGEVGGGRTLATASNFAAFIMAYNSHEWLETSIRALTDQTVVVDKILVIDNSDRDIEFDPALFALHPNVEYLRTEENIGSAGASRLGLERLMAEGYEWVYWGDHDDPPEFPDDLETLLSYQDKVPSVGILGTVGSDYSRRWGTSRRYENDELVGDTMSVGWVGGNHSILVHRDVVAAGCLPHAELFFGFEDLDICQQAIAAGFEVVVPTERFIRYRELAGRWDPDAVDTKADREREWRGSTTWREYYSNRNMVWWHWHRTRNLPALGYVLARMTGKIAMSARFGPRRGWWRARLLLRAVRDGLRADMGRTLGPADFSPPG